MYLLGDSKEELNRLAIQANLLIDKQLFQIVRTGDKILELGCGTGSTLAQFMTRNIHVHYTGLDISPETIAIASKQFPNATFLQSDVNELDELDIGEFDIVICKLLLWSTASPKAILEYCRKKLKQLGIIYIFEPFSEGVLTYPPLYHFQTLINEWHIQAKHHQHNPSIGIEISSMLLELNYQDIQSSVFHLSSCRQEAMFKPICDNLISFYCRETNTNPAMTISEDIQRRARHELLYQCDFISDVFIRTIAKIRE